MLEIKRIRGLMGHVSYAVIDTAMDGIELAHYNTYYDAVDFIRCMEGL